MDKEKIQELDMKIMEVIEMIAEGMDRGYEDEYVKALYIAKDSLDKLEKIEKIIYEYNNGDDMEYVYLDKIREVLESED